MIIFKSESYTRTLSENHQKAFVQIYKIRFSDIFFITEYQCIFKDE